MDASSNMVNEIWFRGRLERDGYSQDSADLPPRWKPGVSSMTGAHEKFGNKKNSSENGA
jgi:hypothetical protein